MHQEIQAAENQARRAIRRLQLWYTVIGCIMGLGVAIGGSVYPHSTGMNRIGAGVMAAMTWPVHLPQILLSGGRAD